MSKRDILDEQMAKRFRWRAFAPEGAPDPSEVEPPKPPPAPLPENQIAPAERARWEEAARACADLARQAERVWEMTPRARQAAATVTLFERMQRLGVDLFGMGHHPRATVRLWRLIVRHHGRLPARDRKFGIHALSYAAPPPGEREIVDLLAEIAETGNGWLTFVIEQSGAIEAAGRRHPDLSARLARILDTARTWAARAIAARWLSFTELGDATASLRRALRMPHARIRWMALDVLLELKPSALTEADVLWLLEDAVKHPLPGPISRRAFDTVDGYGDALIVAVAKVTPPEGWRPLEIIEDGGGAHIRRERGGLDDGWALRALAAGYPERAVARIDRALLATRGGKYDAVKAAALLPDDLARPRLLDAAAGPGHLLVEVAKQAWFKRFGGECPVEPLAGVQVELLSAPPSERLFSCLTVIRGASKEACGALLAALFAEIPAPPASAEGPAALSASQRETLALLLFGLRDMGFMYAGARLPKSCEPWAALLVERFGEPAFEGLAALAARGALAGVDHEWLAALAGLARAGALRPSWRARLADLGRDALCSPAWNGATAPLIALHYAGAPPDLLERVWTIAMPEACDAATTWRPGYAAQRAADILVAMKDTPTLDERIAAEGEEALRARAFAKLQSIIDIGCRRLTPAALDLATRCLAGVEDDPDTYDLAVRCGYALDRAGRIEEAWLLDALRSPASLRFSIAARFVGKQPSLALLDALHRALDSGARDGAAAAEAAHVLVWAGAIGAEDHRLDGILERAPARARGQLAGMLLLLDAPLAPLRRHFVELLRCTDEKVASDAFEDLYMKRTEDTYDLFEAVLPLGPLPSIRESIEHFLGEPSEAELYWRDAGDEEEDDDEGE